RTPPFCTHAAPAAVNNYSIDFCSTFSQSYSDHRALLSFPTRRSSDLLPGRVQHNDVRPLASLGQHLGSLRRVPAEELPVLNAVEDRKSTRLNSSHVSISYAVFCLKKKNRIIIHFNVEQTLVAKRSMCM